MPSHLSSYGSRVSRSELVRIGLMFVASVAVFAGACGRSSDTQPGGPTGDGSTGGASSGGPTFDSDGGAATTGGDGSTEPQVLIGKCTIPDGCQPGECGPKPQCDGRIVECGQCSGGLACDLKTNSCITPRVTCEQLLGPKSASNKTCGLTRSTCGEEVNCGACDADERCDRNTNKCVPAKALTCAQAGRKCGPFWNGVGDRNDPANILNCDPPAGIPSDKVCNPVYGVIECKSGTAGCPALNSTIRKQLCDAARDDATRKIQCGTISDGRGGVLDCSIFPEYQCTGGKTCGALGEPNRCNLEPPPYQCVVAGHECDPADEPLRAVNACTGARGGCGSCPAGLVCNDNGKCGPPCAPKTCDQLFAENPGAQCGTFPDGCGGNRTCGCPGSGVCDNASKQCCNPTACNPGRCGDNLPGRCGQSCTCGSPTVCRRVTTPGGDTYSTPFATPPSGEEGKCCTRATSASKPASVCGFRFPDGCGGTFNKACGGGSICVGTVGGSTVELKKNINAHANIEGFCCNPGKDCGADSCVTLNDVCGIAGRTHECRTCSAGQICGNPPAPLTCCDPPAACTPGVCNVPRANACADLGTCGCGGSTPNCVCTNGGDHICAPADPAGQCRARRQCAGGNVGDVCGTGLNDNIGGTISCNCASPRVCSSSTAGVEGTCQCPPGTPLNSAAACGSRVCGSASNGCGGTVGCGTCPGGQACTAEGTCCALPPTSLCNGNTSGTNGDIGASCGKFSNTCGSITCGGCATTNGRAKNQCQSNVCVCTPLTYEEACQNQPVGPRSNGCGGFYNCTS